MSEPHQSLASLLAGFASFEVLISPSLLLVFYYLGAIGAPLAAWFMMQRFVAVARRVEIPNAELAGGIRQFWLKGAWRIRLMVFVAFVFFELFWRMMFEFLIAYFQIRDALLH
jgi:hypothetical protein